MKSFFLFLPLISFFLCVSCGQSEVDVLRKKLDDGYSITIEDKASRSKYTKTQYVEIEKQYNEKYVNDLRDLIDNSFEKQLDAFEDGELGIWKGIWRPFSLFKSKQTRIDEMSVKSKSYFNSLNVQQDAQILFEQYNEDVKNLRKRYRLNQTNVQTNPNVVLPEYEINIGHMDEYTVANIAIDIFTDGIPQIVSLVFDCTVVGLLIGIPIAIFASMKADSRLLDSLRKQYHDENNVDYDGILKSLNKNTDRYYANI